MKDSLRLTELPNLRAELGTSVRDNVQRYSVQAENMMDKELVEVSREPRRK